MHLDDVLLESSLHQEKGPALDFKGNWICPAKMQWKESDRCI